jgi:pimeloyl-ACP methyl ester carboxylesterase
MKPTADTVAHAEPPLALLESRFAARNVALAQGASVSMRATAGEGATNVVLLHGIGSGAGSWLHCALALDGVARVIAWDAPGYGDSSPLAAAQPTASDYAAHLHELLAAIDVDRCVLVGHSLGALVAAAYAHGPGRAIVQRLVLISPARGYGAQEQAEPREQTRHSRLTTLRERGVEGIAAQAPSRMLTERASEAARAWVRWNASRLNAGGYAQAVEMLCGDDIERYAGLAAPVEVYVGADDAVTRPEACRRIAERFDAPFALIDDAGHASPIEQPERVARLIAGAVARSSWRTPA